MLLRLINKENNIAGKQKKDVRLEKLIVFQIYLLCSNRQPSNTVNFKGK
jgi:hypothetical protein